MVRHHTCNETLTFYRWVKVNPGTTGFYRVKYSSELLDKLLPAVRKMELPATDRLSLQNDLFALVCNFYIRFCVLWLCYFPFVLGEWIFVYSVYNLTATTSSKALIWPTKFLNLFKLGLLDFKTKKPDKQEFP